MKAHCVVCGKEFEAERASAKYDSPNCRAIAFRERRRTRKRDQGRDIAPEDLESFKLLDAINKRAGEMILEIQREHGKPAARRALRVFDLLLEQGLVVRR